MRTILTTSAMCSLLFASAGIANAEAPAQTLAVRLQDSSTDPSIAHMHIVVDHDTLKAGRVTLQAENPSTIEVLVVRDSGAKELPLNAKRDRVIESRMHPLSEIADLHRERQAN